MPYNPDYDSGNEDIGKSCNRDMEPSDDGWLGGDTSDDD